MSLKKLFSTIFSFLGKIFSHLIPSLPAVKLAAKLILILSAIILLIVAFPYISTIGTFNTLIFIVAIAFLVLLSGLLLNLILALILKIPSSYRLALIALLIITSFFFYINTEVFILTFLYLMVATSFIGFFLYQISRQKGKEVKLFFRITHYLMFLIGLAALILWAYWLIQSGSGIEAPLIASLQTEYRPVPIALPNPAEYGPYPVVYMTYGSGKDKHRPEYGEQTDLITQPVDGSKLLPTWSGFNGKMRTWYFGFDAKKLPLNGRVWYPDGVGPFPLIFIVHGNHLAQDYSDPGYEYLGELWASRGMITVSVDQNFLNGSFTDIFGGLSDENDARGWLLLEHLRQWTDWDNSPDNPFYRRVDLDYIALIGHSRGGEAIAHAALFNTLPYYPDDASLVFNYNFSIVSLIAIAPCDAQYQPSIVRTPLKDINYLTIHGSHDADVTSFSGKRQFERLTFSPDYEGFAATVYIYGANHGQFNTVWGNTDSSAPYINHYNLRQLMSGEEQRQIGKVFMTAFLERTMMYAPEYERLFWDYRSAPASWLPETIYLQQYKRAGMYPLSNFDEDLNLTTTTIANGKITGNNLTDWYERRIRLKDYSMDSKAVHLGWNTEDDSLIAAYNIELPPNHINESILYLTLADTGKLPTKRDEDISENDGNGDTDIVSSESEAAGQNQKEDVEDEVEEDKPQWIDFSIKLTDNRNNELIFPVSSFSPIQPLIEAKLGKLDLIHPTPFGESVLQLFTFDLKKLQELNPQFNRDRVAVIELIFDITPQGHILINELGFMSEKDFRN